MEHLIVFRLGTFLPIPGINPIALQQFFEQQSSGILGIFDTFSGGALGRMGIFALGVMPYISSSIIMTLMQSAIPYLKSLKEQGTKGRRQLLQYSRYFNCFNCSSSRIWCIYWFRVYANYVWKYSF